MRRSRSLMALLALILSLPGSSAGQAGDSSAVSTSEFQLKHAGARDMATILRTIAGTRQFEIPSERVIRITDTTEVLELSKQLVTALDSPAPGTVTLPTGDSQVVVFRLHHARPADAMKALRTVLQVSKIAVQQEPPVVIIRDTAEKNKSAQALLEIVDRACR